jgi:hypothetical protein
MCTESASVNQEQVHLLIDNGVMSVAILAQVLN